MNSANRAVADWYSKRGERDKPEKSYDKPISELLFEDEELVEED